MLQMIRFKRIVLNLRSLKGLSFFPTRTERKQGARVKNTY